MSGIIILFVGLPMTQLMRSQPEDYGLLPDGATHPKPADAKRDKASTYHQQHSLTTRQALRTRAFWFISFGHALAVSVVAAITVHLVIHLNEGLGYSLQMAASIIALMTFCAMAGQLIGGFLGDRFNKRLIVTLAMFGHASALLAVTFANSFAWVLFFAVIHGLAWGIRGPLMQALRADYFGRRSFATIMGLSLSIVMLGQMIGPLIAGYLADHFGNYRLGFTVLAGLAAFGSIFFIFAKEPVQR